MNDLAVGLAAIAIGLLFCFYGAPAMRIVIAIWGAFVGFNLGAGIVAAVWDQGYLSTSAAWFTGFVLALVFAVLAYLFYAVAVLLATMSIGFALGTALMGALGITWNWLIILVAVVAGAALGLVAIATNLPYLLLIVLSSMGGASVTVTGVMLVVGVVDTSQFDQSQATVDVPHDWWWFALYIALAIAGVLSQSRAKNRAWNRATWESTSAPA